MREREAFFLSIVIPRFRTWRAAFADWSSRTLKRDVVFWLGAVSVLYIATASICASSNDESGICAGGPLDEDGLALSYLTFGENFGPPILNSLATLMLSFHANQCLGLYQKSYEACQEMKASLVQLVTLVAGTVQPSDDGAVTPPCETPATAAADSRGLRMEFWRVANLYHASTYVLADKTRLTYNFDNFLVPVATAFGDFDAGTRLGMLRRNELDLLYDSHSAHVAHAERRSQQEAAASEQEAAASEQRDSQSGSSGSRGSRRLSTGGVLSGAPASVGSVFASVLNGAPSASEHKETAGLRQQSRRRRTSLSVGGAALTDSRGDVRSRTAILHSALGVRLYRLAEFALRCGHTQAAWPVWGTHLTRFLDAAEVVKQRALYRLPGVYLHAVRYFIASTVVTDTFVLGARAGRFIAYAAAHPEWTSHALFGSALILVVNVLAVYFVLVLLQGLAMMEQPFGSDIMDLPCLSYVCAAADTSLRMVEGRGAAAADASADQRLVSELLRLDAGELVNEPTTKRSQKMAA